MAETLEKKLLFVGGRFVDQAPENLPIPADAVPEELASQFAWFKETYGNQAEIHYFNDSTTLATAMGNLPKKSELLGIVTEANFEGVKTPLLLDPDKKYEWGNDAKEGIVLMKRLTQVATFKAVVSAYNHSDELVADLNTPAKKDAAEVTDPNLRTSHLDIKTTESNKIATAFGNYHGLEIKFPEVKEPKVDPVKEPKVEPAKEAEPIDLEIQEPAPVAVLIPEPIRSDVPQHKGSTLKTVLWTAGVITALGLTGAGFGLHYLSSGNVSEYQRNLSAEIGKATKKGLISPYQAELIATTHMTPDFFERFSNSSLTQRLTTARALISDYDVANNSFEDLLTSKGLKGSPDNFNLSLLQSTELASYINARGVCQMLGIETGECDADLESLAKRQPIQLAQAKERVYQDIARGLADMDPSKIANVDLVLSQLITTLQAADSQYAPFKDGLVPGANRNENIRNIVDAYTQHMLGAQQWDQHQKTPTPESVDWKTKYDTLTATNGQLQLDYEGAQATIKTQATTIAGKDATIAGLQQPTSRHRRSKPTTTTKKVTPKKIVTEPPVMNVPSRFGTDSYTY
ncbi:hypothetical protein HN587_00470 [Candidatus Woesearchaeota archaeon]|jgi:hypothetical protein|nr:hypothetical protein [Candidatus Woesearchaeota archaeon]